MRQLPPKATYSFFFYYFSQFFIGIVIVAFPGSIILEEVTGSYKVWIWGIAAIVGAALCYGWALLVYQNWRYDFTDEGVKIERGVIRKEHTTIPYTRIQNIDVKQSVVSRILSLGRLVIQTAGSSPSQKSPNYFTLNKVIRLLAYHGSSSNEEGEGIIPGLDIKRAREFQETLTEGL